MPRFPFFSFPYNYSYYNYPKYHNINKNSIIDNKTNINNTIKSSFNHNHHSSDKECPIFEIFGIKLYLDDLIIIGLLFFLYQEKVNDEMLYIILFLLLFS